MSDDAIPERSATEISPAAEKRGGRKKSTGEESSASEQSFKDPFKDTGKPAKKRKGGQLPWFKEGTTLSKQESEELKEPLAVALRDDFGYADQLLWWRTDDKNQVPCWSDMTDEEVDVLVRMMIKSGQHSPAAAKVARTVAAGNDYASALIITVPRTIQMVDRLHNAPVAVARRENRQHKKKEKAA